MKRILVLDDDIEMRQLLRLMLEQAGYEVVAAGGGYEGMRLFRKEPTDLVITEMTMPEKDGIETIRELQRDFPRVKIIAISGGGQRVDPQRVLKIARDFGAAHTFAKPFKREALLEAVQTLIGVPNAT